MKQVLDLNRMDVTTLTEAEANQIEGGILPVWAVSAIIAVAVSAVNNFGGIRQGFVDCWNGSPKK